MKKLKELLAVSNFLFAFAACIAQTENKDVTITASGSGASQEDAKQAALRSAIEQAYGAFISTKTEMLNDQVVADQMTSVSSGNIKSYEVLNQDQLPDGRWGVTLKTIVSVDKLTSFVQAKGINIEIKGGLFALNIKQQGLNEQGEVQAVAEMVGLLHEPMQTAFDYSIKSGEPKSLDAENKNWEIPLEVTATCNKNIEFCANYFIKTLKALSLSENEVETYKSLNKKVFSITVKYDSVYYFYLRKQTSINIIYALLANWDFYVMNYSIQSGIFESCSNTRGQLYPLYTSKNSFIKDNPVISFLKSGKIAGVFSCSDKRTISQIEQMTGYSIKSKGVVSKFKNGGYVVYEKNGHGLVAAICDIGELEWKAAQNACDELLLNGYSDWYLPSKSELEFLSNNLHKNSVGIVGEVRYWSRNRRGDIYAWAFWYLGKGEGAAESYRVTDKLAVRPVRSF